MAPPKGKPPAKPFAKGNKLGRKFQKGQSGNPSGKTLEDVEFERLCRQKSPRALAIIEGIAENAEHPKQFDAAKWIAEQGHGTARKRVEVTGAGGGPQVFEIREVEVPPRG